MNGTSRSQPRAAGLEGLAASHLCRAADQGAAEDRSPFGTAHQPIPTGTEGAYRPDGSLDTRRRRLPAHRRLSGLEAGMTAPSPRRALPQNTLIETLIGAVDVRAAALILLFVR